MGFLGGCEIPAGLGGWLMEAFLEASAENGVRQEAPARSVAAQRRSRQVVARRADTHEPAEVCGWRWVLIVSEVCSIPGASTPGLATGSDGRRQTGSTATETIG
jgi:hypothetical protein